MKQRFEWRYIEGKNKGNFEWNEPDRIVDAIQQSGLKIVARVDNQPRWASSSMIEVCWDEAAALATGRARSTIASIKARRSVAVGRRALLIYLTVTFTLRL